MLSVLPALPSGRSTMCQTAPGERRKDGLPVKPKRYTVSRPTQTSTRVCVVLKRMDCAASKSSGRAMENTRVCALCCSVSCPERGAVGGR